MYRPKSIIRFERFYFASVFLGIFISAVEWSNTRARFAASPSGPVLGSWFLFAAIVLVFGLSILLWYFIARKASNVARWINIVLFALALFSLPGMFAQARVGAISGLAFLMNVANFSLSGLATWMLFRPDVRAWFAGQHVDLADTFS